MIKNTFIAATFVASAMTIGCDSAQFSGSTTVVGYDGADESTPQKENNASAESIKPGKSSNDSANKTDDVSNDYQFKFQLAENDAQESFELNQTVSNQKNLTLHASYINVEKAATAIAQDSYYTAINYNGRILQQKRRFFDKKFIDVILVVDNSSSMKTPQERLAAALPSLKSSLQGMSWRIILTTTDNNDACALKVMDANTSDAELSNSVLLGSNGSDQEIPLYRAYNIIAGKCSVASIRPEAAPAVMILTNEDECSTGTLGNCPVVAGKAIGFPSASGYAFHTYINALPKMAAYDMPVGVIAWLPADATCGLGITKASAISTQLGTSWLYGTRVYGSICAADYSSTLNTFANNIKNMTDPFQTSTSLLFNYAKGNLFLKDSQKFEFNDGSVLKAPDAKLENSIISIADSSSHYDKTAWISVIQEDTPATKLVKWATDAKGGCDPTVTYSGVIGTRDMNTSKIYSSATSVGFPKFTMSPSTCELTLDSLLPYPYQLYVYTTPKAPTKPSIILGENTVQSSVVAKLDNIVLAADGYSITGSNNVLTLANAITSGKLVVSYKSLNDPIIRYDLAIPANATELSVVDSTGVPLTVQRDGTAVVLDRSDIIDGREIEVRYKTMSKIGSKITLSNKPTDLSALYQLIANQCTVSLNVAKSIYNEAEQSIDLASCLNSSNNSKLELQYKYLIANAEFTLPITTENIKSIDNISVTLNGKEYVEYSLTDNVMTLPSPKETGEVVVQLKVTTVGQPQ